MATTLKSFFNKGVVESIAHDLHVAHAALDKAAFIIDVMKGLSRLELTARGWHVADVMHRHLPSDYAHAARIVVASLGPPLDRTEDFGMAPFRTMGHAFFVARYGLDHFAPSMAALYEITKRFTAEFSIRAFIEKYPDDTYAQLQTWARDDSVHVRRLVSEGTRPRLPWAQRLREYQRDPTPVIALLDLLKDDGERYVQRSVANSVNDISKDHPQVAVELCRRWLAESTTPGRVWIVSHALRGLVKAGDTSALEVAGFGEKPRVRLERATATPKRVRMGETVQLAFDVVSTARDEQTLLLDYVVHFVKKNGTASRKVFKLKKLTIAGGARVSLGAKVSFADKTTRVHHPGLHRVEALINGVVFALADIDVRSP